MRTELHLILSPEQAYKKELTEAAVAEALKTDINDISCIRIIKKSIDARSAQPKINLWVEVFSKGELPKTEITHTFDYHNVSGKPAVIIVGSGPAGLFAALRLIELDIRPIVLEQGKDIYHRKKDLAQLNQNKAINPNSNYCFGAGGAGTFSDGKLYTRSKKKGNVQRVFEIFYLHGAQENVLYEAHPHIGSDRLPLVIKDMVNTIIENGGEVHYESKVSEICWNEKKQITGCKTEDGKQFGANALVLATGHSARDVYEMLHKKGVLLEQKGFAMGVRVEHQQSLIDSIQYHSKIKDEYLPAASYNLVEQINGRGVYSFCMCPGGRIVPAVGGKEEIVVNGMSISKRNSPFANSGIMVEIRPEDIPEEFSKYGVLAGLKYQQYLENLAYKNNGGLGLTAPAQRLGDFVKGVLSADLPECSYTPGLISSPLHFWLPEFISSRLREGFKFFNQKMHGYLTNEAVVVGVETRSSSPLRIPRDPETAQHPEIEGLFPCGEGAGYSGGITSSAIDGENAAQKVAEFFS